MEVPSSPLKQMFLEVYASLEDAVGRTWTVSWCGCCRSPRARTRGGFPRTRLASTALHASSSFVAACDAAQARSRRAVG